MRSDLPLLSSLEIAAPCPMSWAAMDGSDTKRYCDSCHLHVHDLSALTSQEAETLLQTHHGELCVRYTQDSDGQILTDEFPTPLRPMRWLVLKHCAIVAAFVLLLLTAGVHQASAETKPAKAKTTTAKKVVRKPAQPPRMGEPVRRSAPAPSPQAVMPSLLGKVGRDPAPQQEPKAVVPPLMGVLVVKTAAEPLKPKTAPALEPRGFLGRVATKEELQRAQELHALQEQEKEPPKPPDSPKK